MAKGVFIQNPESIYDDAHALHYHFPKMYLSRVKPIVGDWAVLYESGSQKGRRAYTGVAEVKSIRPDLARDGFFYADYAPDEVFDFAQIVPLRRPDGLSYYSRNIQRSPGKPNGVAQSAVQPLREDDFWDIVRVGMDAESVLPRDKSEDVEILQHHDLAEGQSEFFAPSSRETITTLLTKKKRSRAFRARVLSAYNFQCALTGLGFRNGGGRAEVQAAHIKPVEHNGPDRIDNGLALSGTVHWMFDRGLLSLSDAGDIMVSRKVNDIDGLNKLLWPDRKARLPLHPQDHPNSAYLRWHRETVFEK